MSSNFRYWIETFSIDNHPLIHAGAHYAEERDDYRDLRFEPVYWIEALPEVAAVGLKNLNGYSNQYLISAAISNVSGQEVCFYVAGDEDSSSSLHEPYLIEASHPEVSLKREIFVVTTTLDVLHSEGKLGDFEFYGLVLDLQGGELKALMGAQKLLSRISFVITEISTRELYKGGVRFDEMKGFLESCGFTLIASEVNRGTGWGEALFINRLVSILNVPISANNETILVGKYSIGTALRSLLVKIGAPRWLIKFVKR